jgi:hypothetical protein
MEVTRHIYHRYILYPSYDLALHSCSFQLPFTDDAIHHTAFELFNKLSCFYMRSSISLVPVWSTAPITVSNLSCMFRHVLLPEFVFLASIAPVALSTNRSWK